MKKKYLFLTMLFLAIGFASVAVTLFVNGTIKVSANTEEFDVYFSKVLVNGVEDNSLVSDDTHITFLKEFKSFGDSHEVEYYITNGSTNYDAKVSVSCSEGNDYVEITSDWIDETVIDSTETKSGKLTMSLKRTYTGDTSLNLPVTCEITVNATERDSKGTGTPASKVEKGPIAVSFADDSWETIAAAVKSGNYVYQVGDTKTITLASHTNDCSFSPDQESYGVFASIVCISSVEVEKEVTLRVANTTECTNGETSETACGFVVEFVDIIENHNMNPADAANIYGTNVGGWKDSSMRTYVNGTLYNALPEDLQSVIVDTTVVSGHGSTSGETNFTTTDKLYLLNAQEVWGINSNDTSVGTSRQLDYYANLGVTESNYAGAIKQYNGSNSYWWLRSAASNYTENFLGVDNGGRWIFRNAKITYGISPSFRIA